MTTLDWIAVAVFAVFWLGYEPILERMARRGAITLHMRRLRQQWMRAMVSRQSGLTDANLLGHTLNSASFFASSNLILIAAVAGALFGGGRAVIRVLPHVPGVEPSHLLKIKLALVTACLVRGLLDLIWSIRQLNYCLALVGGAHEGLKPDRREAYAGAVADVLNPALNAFSHGVRAYYFALAAGAWLFGPWALMATALGAFTLLVWRQSASPAARAIARARALLED